ncbi:hypothetical protein GCM10010913_28850 [Paenibacillus aceti]|uniref:Uncharacterized protein n=1 Tax=Paenibacillus aceti TaxID=1820010 RepID=A0ABQ1VZC1_9BACL|nr:hypothetical protein GCM10010913_28850 [Paenibacillus aceti]
MGEFDGEKFAEFLILVIVIGLLFYGSTDIADYITGPTPV